MASVALVTDSTAHLQVGAESACGVTVVPLQVVIDDEVYDEGSVEATPEKVAEALREKRAVESDRIVTFEQEVAEMLVRPFIERIEGA